MSESKLTDQARRLLTAPNFCHVSTIRPDGSVLPVLVWVDLDGDEISVNSAQGRAWPTNLERDPRVSLLISNQENPYEWVSIRGTVSNITTDGADEQIDALAKKYMGVDKYPLRKDGEQRIKIVIDPDTTANMGG